MKPLTYVHMIDRYHTWQDRMRRLERLWPRLDLLLDLLEGEALSPAARDMAADVRRHMDAVAPAWRRQEV